VLPGEIEMHRLLKQWFTWTVAAMLLCPSFLQAQSATRVSVFNLRDYGWEPPDPHHHSTNTPSITIDHENRVLLGFAAQQRRGLVTRNQPSLDFRVIRLSLGGTPDLSLSLPTNAAGTTAVYLSDSDQIITRANNNLLLLEKSKTNPQEWAWITLATCAERCLIEQSSTRHTMLLSATEAGPVTVIHLSQQPETQHCGNPPRQTESPEDEIQNYPQAITDTFAYFSGQTSRLDDYTYRWPFCDYEHRTEMKPTLRGRVTVLGDQTFISDAGKDLEVVSSDGKVKFRQPMAKHEFWDNWEPIRSSERGERIAVDIRTVRGGNQTLDISSHVTARRVAVYDIEAGKEVASIPVNRGHRYSYEFDLSPDGKRLAILEDNIVKVVDLEPALPGDKPNEHTDTVVTNPKQ
jgi:hypothetical protein